MKIITFLIAFLFISSCKNPQKLVEVPSTFDEKQLIGIIQKPQLISKENIAEIAGIDSSKIKIYSENFAADVSKRKILFSWPNGNKKAIKTTDGKDLQLDSYSSLGLGFITKISKIDFQNKYESKSAIQNEIDRITKDESIDADIAIAEAKNWAENAKIQHFEKLDNVGESSYWEIPVNALHVYYNGMAFTVTTNLENENQSKEKAIELVDLVFNNAINTSK